MRAVDQCAPLKVSHSKRLRPLGSRTGPAGFALGPLDSLWARWIRSGLSPSVSERLSSTACDTRKGNWDNCSTMVCRMGEGHRLENETGTNEPRTSATLCGFRWSAFPRFDSWLVDTGALVDTGGLVPCR